jgi:hypothetical protein
VESASLGVWGAWPTCPSHPASSPIKPASAVYSYSVFIHLFRIQARKNISQKVFSIIPTVVSLLKIAQYMFLS